MTNISSLAPVLTKFIKLTDAEPSLSCDPMQSSSLVLQSDIMLHQWHAALQWGAWQSGSGKGSPSVIWSQVPVWQILCGDSGMGEQSFLAAAFNSLEPTYFLKSRPFYILNPRYIRFLKKMIKYQILLFGCYYSNSSNSRWIVPILVRNLEYNIMQGYLSMPIHFVFCKRVFCSLHTCTKWK